MKKVFLILVISTVSIFTKAQNDLPNIIAVKPNAMTLGIKLSAPTPQPEKYYDDLVHPCVRYIPDGFAGHKWWMVGTPYYDINSTIENPILYYGDSRAGNLPPLQWTAVGVVADTPPEIGYNSDPCIYYDGKGLWVFWRENWTTECIASGYDRATFGKYTLDGATFGTKKLFAGEVRGDVDSEMCPIVVKFDGKIKLYGCHHEFTPIRRPLGLSIWDISDNDLEHKMFSKTKDVLPSYKAGFDFWHFDMFEYESKYYCVVTPESGTEILLGRSNDGENFKFWKTPLLSGKVTGRNYFYKPSAIVHEGIFYLWNPVSEEGVKVRTSRIWMSEIKFNELIQLLDKQDDPTKTDSIEPSTKGTINIYSTINGISIYNTDKPTYISIYTINGDLVYKSFLNTGSSQISLMKGIYIITAESKKFKIIVR